MSNVADVCGLCEYTCEIKLSTESFNSDELLPNNLCILAFHSIYPYLLTLTNKGWFNWVSHREQVIVNCPSIYGISMYVKSSSHTDENSCEAKIMRTRGDCPNGHQLGETFLFNFDPNNKLKYELLDKVVPYLSMNEKSSNQHPLELTYFCEEEEFKFKFQFQKSE